MEVGGGGGPGVGMELSEIWGNRFGLDDSLYISQVAVAGWSGEGGEGQMLSSALHTCPQVAGAGLGQDIKNL